MPVKTLEVDLEWSVRGAGGKALRAERPEGTVVRPAAGERPASK